MRTKKHKVHTRSGPVSAGQLTGDQQYRWRLSHLAGTSYKSVETDSLWTLIGFVLRTREIWRA